MEICDFAFHQPTTLTEACDLGRKHGRDARFLAGGTEILPDFKQGRDTARHLIGLQRIQELHEIRDDGKFLRIGGAATLSAVAESSVVHRIFPPLAEAVLSIAAMQIRNVATLGGNFCGGVPSADTPPICIVGEARTRLVGVEGERVLPAERFFLGPREVDLQRGELLAEILIPIQPRGSGASYQRFARRRATALPVAAVAARVVLTEERISGARVALGAVAPTPILATECAEILLGGTPSEALFARAAGAAADASRPITDLRGSIEFRRELVDALTRRALRLATARARGEAG